MMYTWDKLTPTPRPGTRRNISRCWAIAPSITTVGGGHDAGDPAVGAEHRSAAGYRCVQMGALHVKEDPTQFNDLAAQMPEKVKELQASSILRRRSTCAPLDNGRCCAGIRPCPSLTAGERFFNYSAN